MTSLNKSAMPRDTASQLPEESSAAPNPELPHDMELQDKKITDAVGGESSSAVRFASTVEEISPTAAGPILSQSEAEGAQQDAIAEVMSDQIKELSSSLKATDLQGKQFSKFSFEPYSLPASRVHSREDLSAGSTRVPTPNRGSPRLAPSQHAQTPPLTPADTNPADAKKRAGPNEERKTAATPDLPVITPQASSSRDAASPQPERRTAASPHLSSDQIDKDGLDDREGRERSHRKGMFDVGPGGSASTSRESSPTRAFNHYSKSQTPRGDLNDPYAANRRLPPNRHPDRTNVEPRFQFSRRKPGQGPSPTASTTSLNKPDKRHSTLFGGRKHHAEELQDDASSLHSRHGSFADLKRFFVKGGHHHKKEKDSRPSSRSGMESGTKTPPSVRPGQQRQPFGDDHGLTSKYGTLGRVLGSGAGGKVRLMKRQDDVVFAVKEFRERYSYETQKEYVKRLTAEFCVGSTLNHGNIIETLDVVQENNRWYQVMEYAPYDLFAIVMTGKMTRPEVTCCFLQILNGVTYLHSMGLAHRDLKLDNVVVSDRGIMKIIDFGSSHVFKYPFESNTIMASGIVGSDPYLAPEVLTERKYDAQAVDVWSLAIIFCCMSLRRFPWKVPKMTDNSFKLFAADPTPGHDPKKLALPSRSTNDLSTTRARDFLSADDEGQDKKQQSATGSRDTPQDENEQSQKQAAKDVTSAAEEKKATPAPATKTAATGQEKKEIIRGPWRVLRVLPRESRHIIGRMLELKPEDRATMDEITQDSWIADSEMCSQEGPGGLVTLAEGHTHILEYPQTPSNGN